MDCCERSHQIRRKRMIKSKFAGLVMNGCHFRRLSEHRLLLRTPALWVHNKILEFLKIFGPLLFAPTEGQRSRSALLLPLLCEIDCHDEFDGSEVHAVMKQDTPSCLLPSSPSYHWSARIMRNADDTYNFVQHGWILSQEPF